MRKRHELKARAAFRAKATQFFVVLFGEPRASKLLDEPQ